MLSAYKTICVPVPVASDDEAAAQAKLDAAGAELEQMNAERGLRDAFDAEAPERLHMLANMGPILLGPLHAILGYADMLRMDSGLTAHQFDQVNALFAAASDLVGCVQRVLSLADLHAHLNGAALTGGQVAGVTDEASGPGPTAHVAAGAATRSLRVLIADDSAMNREIAAAFLRDAGHRVILADNGAEAISAAATAELDAILMDVRMPGMDGLEATRRIRALPGATSRVPIIALTSLSFTEDAALCNEAGMNGHLTKPFSRETLTDVVLRAAAHRATQADIPAGAPSMPASGSFKPKTMPAAVAGRAAPADWPGEWRVPDRPPAAGPETPAWLDTDTPWDHPSRRHRSGARPGTPRGLFDLKLTAMTVKGRLRLFDTMRSCRPQAPCDQHCFHWLVFVPSDLETGDGFTAPCELWRWVRGAWSSTAVTGAVFSPDEMYEQGWRYCGPCEEKVAQIEITTKAREAARQS
jgi:CheY-like chemotaxis protein